MNGRRTLLPCVVLLLLFIGMIQPTHSQNDEQDRFYSDALTIYSRQATHEDIATLMSLQGVYEEGTTYNIIIDGYGTGLRPPTVEEWNAMASSLSIVERIDLAGGMDSLPATIDHSASIHFPPVGSQGQEGSCVAWAVGYYTKTFQEAVERGWDFSDASWTNGEPTPSYQDKIMSPDFIYHQINGGVDGGSTYNDAITLVTSVGASSWALMPYSQYDHTSWPSETAWREAPLYRGDGGFNYAYFSSVGIDSLKALLADGVLGIISIDANQYGAMTDDIWTTDTYVLSGTNHANTVVGYDDTKAYTEGGQTKYGAFKVVNSWGPTWSGDGTYWISYNAMAQVVRYFMYYYDRIAYEPETVAVYTIDHASRRYADIIGEQAIHPPQPSRSIMSSSATMGAITLFQPMRWCSI